MEWSNGFTLTSPLGTIDLSGDTAYAFVVDDCDAGTDVRSSKRAIDDGDGDIFGRRSKSGYTMRIASRLYDGGGPAIGSALVDMWDELDQHLDALIEPSLAALGSGECRIEWTPSGSADAWMLDRVRLLSRRRPFGLLPKTVVFELDTELPYQMRASQTTTALPDGVETTLANTGTAKHFFPVFKVYGPTSAFTIVNADALDDQGNPFQISYLGAGLLGGVSIASGHYAEIDSFHNTITLDGSVTFLFAGLDIPGSDLLLPLVPGNNRLTITGADADILWQPAKA